MLPTPAKFHYIFNLRDLSRIWEGILHVDDETITTRTGLMALWKHECQRVISDRFTNPEDREWFNKSITRIATEDLGPEIAGLIPEEPYFVDFLRDPPEATGDEPEDQELEAPKVYEPVRERLVTLLISDVSSWLDNLAPSTTNIIILPSLRVDLPRVALITKRCVLIYAANK